MAERVRTGLEVMADDDFARLKGLRIGLITNPTGILPDLRANIEAMRAAGVKLTALFGPEHGVRGDAAAGESVGSYRDEATGLPVYSLYGKTKVPTSEMLRGLDLLVFDIQDIGSRSYTYLSTLGSVMEGASLHKIPLLVLDRPNPLGGLRVEGSPTDAGFTSFVGKYPTTYIHGLTLGEAAQMINGEGWLPGGRRCSLTIAVCKNLTRNRVGWDAMGGLPWVPTSPHVPYAHTAFYYAATGIVGELPTVSIGVGYPMPFELAGAPHIGATALARNLSQRGLVGWRFRPTTWVPFYALFKGEPCGGAQVLLEDVNRADLTRLNWEIMAAFRVLAPNRPLFGDAAKMFDLSCGTDGIRKAFLRGASATELNQIWNRGRDGFIRARRPYLIYS